MTRKNTIITKFKNNELANQLNKDFALRGLQLYSKINYHDSLQKVINALLMMIKSNSYELRSDNNYSNAVNLLLRMGVEPGIIPRLQEEQDSEFYYLHLVELLKAYSLLGDESSESIYLDSFIKFIEVLKVFKGDKEPDDLRHLLILIHSMENILRSEFAYEKIYNLFFEILESKIFPEYRKHLLNFILMSLCKVGYFSKKHVEDLIMITRRIPPLILTTSEILGKIGSGDRVKELIQDLEEKQEDYRLRKGISEFSIGYWNEYTGDMIDILNLSYFYFDNKHAENYLQEKLSQFLNTISSKNIVVNKKTYFDNENNTYHSIIDTDIWDMALFYIYTIKKFNLEDEFYELLVRISQKLVSLLEERNISHFDDLELTIIILLEEILLILGKIGFSDLNFWKRIFNLFKIDSNTDFYNSLIFHISNNNKLIDAFAEDLLVYANDIRNSLYKRIECAYVISHSNSDYKKGAKILVELYKENSIIGIVGPYEHFHPLNALSEKSAFIGDNFILDELISVAIDQKAACYIRIEASECIFKLLGEIS